MTRELILFQEHHIATRAAVAQRLRELAEKVEGRRFTLGEHTVVLPERVSFKSEYDAEESDAAEGEGAGQVYELEFELRLSLIHI